MSGSGSDLSIDNGTVRVTTWTLGAGDSTGAHRHELDYVVVPLVDGQLSMADGSGTVTVELVRGGCYFRPAGVEHDVSNPGADAVVFVEVEVKAPEPA